MNPARRTPARVGRATLEVRRSRFAATAAAVGDEPSLRQWLDDLRRAHREADHLVHAWRGFPPVPGGQPPTRGSDDGEPHGTGSRACLVALTRPDLQGAAVAVARRFGGSLLGSAGLARAYGAAAAAAVADAGARDLRLHVPFTALVEASAADAAARALKAMGATDVRCAADAAGVRYAGWLPAEAIAQAARALAAAASARANLSPTGAAQWR